MKILSTLLFVFTLFFLQACGQNEANLVNPKATTTDLPDDWETFSKDGCNLSYPKKWTLDKSGKMGTTFYVFTPSEGVDDNFGENVNLLTEDLPNDKIDLDQLCRSSRKKYWQLYC